MTIRTTKSIQVEQLIAQIEAHLGVQGISLRFTEGVEEEGAETEFEVTSHDISDEDLGALVEAHTYDPDFGKSEGQKRREALLSKARTSTPLSAAEMQEAVALLLEERMSP